MEAAPELYQVLGLVNGVAQLHSDVLKAELFAYYVSIWPNMFQNKTNGINPRRWLRFCSPALTEIITKWLKTDKWVTNFDLLVGLRQVCVIPFFFTYFSANTNLDPIFLKKFADNPELQSEWDSTKMANKQRLAHYILRVRGETIDPNTLFDIQVKRIHENKRQVLSILGAVYRYKKLKVMRLVKEGPGKMTLAIGDGANDVSQ